ncbi:MAG: EAL domain-containing protein [Rhodobiaceae bacterium]|nr:EAL domain-containing protein [Rhodobiaceae bacterium]MCC0014498.1 EAL domain-containing protein [Rhodobiaceae bacterium]MCC0050642.1 EAL domain-containing protein [Rhodobiaceae bacterium]MCC0059845.1 EAL domain-containing protein [Rhodobiaceae bacterium]
MKSPAPWALFGFVFACLSFVLALAAPAHALDTVTVRPEAAAIDLTHTVDEWPRHGDRIQVSTAPGPDGIVRRIEVRASETGKTASWVVFALGNNSDEQLDRILVAPHFRLAGSGVLRPDLGSSRIAAITPSQGFRPDRQEAPDADIYLITLDPGTVVTYVVELTGDRLPQLRLWKEEAYKDKANSLTLYQGMVLGIAGLLALFLTILFVVRGTMMFPAAAAMAWAVLAYMCIDFGFWHKLFSVTRADDQLFRASAETIIAGSLVLFFFVYLGFGKWRLRLLTAVVIWCGIIALILALAAIDPSTAAGLSRMILGIAGIAGLVVLLFLSLRGYDRAILLVPTWLLLLGWLFGSWLIVTGRIENDLAAPALNGGMALVILLIGLTVMQHAFAGVAIGTGFLPDLQRKALALIGAGDYVFDWDVARDRLFVGSEIADRLGVSSEQINGSVRKWHDVLHAADRDRFRATLETVVELRRGRVQQDIRLRSADGHYLWVRTKLRPILGADGEIQRIVGTLTDITDAKTSEERLLHDAVHDNLTGLPNRELFLDRLDASLMRARDGEGPNPAVFVIDIDKFRQVNDSIGIAGGDGVLLTLARRLQRLLKPQDTLARLSGDQFGLILVSETETARVEALAEGARKAVRAPMSFAGKEMFLTATIGIAKFDGSKRRREELLEDAEIAMFYAKRLGPDRTESYRPIMRSSGADRLSMSSELRRSIQAGEIDLVYQPIVRLADKRIAGFEALARWNHPRFGRLNPQEFIEIAEENGLIVEIGLLAMDKAASQLTAWQKTVGEERQIFASVNMSSKQLLRHDLVNDVKSVLTRNGLDAGALKLELTESIVMENPEHAAKILAKVRETGAGLALDDFGTGYSSLSYLQRFPFDTVKIDKSFVRQNGSGARPVILKSMVGLAHDLGMDVVAEGAESDRDAAELATLGCEFAQGYYFGRPMSADEAHRLLAYNSNTKH